jgi:tRNA(Ile)-lysidine synthetase-like protein
MALAWLCHEFARSNPDAPKFTGFIVDHGVRGGSAVEATKVRDSLGAFSIRSKILTIDWSKSPSHSQAKSAREVASSSKFETEARTMRYRALGQGCIEAGIDTLLVAHHLNDQAETVLARLCSGYTGAGLRGMLPEANIPESEALDVRPSKIQQGKHPGSHRNLAQRGDDIGAIKIIRPLLEFPKKKLIATCQEAGVEWFEDHTNADTSLTIRNTVRHLLAEDLLPKALRTGRLCQLATTIREQTSQNDQLSNAAYARAKVYLRPSTGLATFEINTSQKLAPDGDDALENHVRAAFIRRLILLVSPTENVTLPHLDAAVDLVFGSDALSARIPRRELGQRVVCIAEVEIRQHLEPDPESPIRRFSIVRTKSPQPLRDSAELHIPIPRSQGLEGNPGNTSTPLQRPFGRLSWTSWHLWDSRYWIRVGHRPQLCAESPLPHLQLRSIIIRFLDQRTITAEIKAQDDISSDLNSLRYALGRIPRSGTKQVVPSALRVILPGVFVKFADDSEQLIAVPTIAWVRLAQNLSKKDAKGQEWHVEWRYKNVDFPRGEMHSIDGPATWSSMGLSRPKRPLLFKRQTVN